MSQAEISCVVGGMFIGMGIIIILFGYIKD
jgi:hypothetical protein